MNKFDKLYQSLITSTAKKYGLDLQEEAIDPGPFIKGQAPDPIPKYKSTQLPIFDYKKVEIALLQSYTGSKPLLIYGPSGIGKSEIVKTVCKEYFAPDAQREFVEWDQLDGKERVALYKDQDRLKNTYMYIDTRTAGWEPVDVQGMEIPTGDIPHMMPKPPLWAYFMSRPGSKGYLFLDEVNQATEEVFNALYSVILDKRAAEMKFAEAWTIGAAGNLGAEHTTSKDLPIALTQRFATIYLIPSIKAWLKWAQTPGKDGEEKVHPLIQTYARSNPSSTFYMNINSAEESASVPNPRNLKLFSDQFNELLEAYANPEESKILWKTGNFLEDIQPIAANHMGADWALGFVTFLHRYTSLDWDKMADNPRDYSARDMGDTFAYVQFVIRNVLEILGTPEMKAHMDEQFNIFHQTGQTSKAAWGEDLYKFMTQFAKICIDLIYKVEWVQDEPQLGDDTELIADEIEQHVQGESELLAVLLSGIRREDQEVLVNISGFLMAFQNTDPLFQKLGIIVDEVLQVTVGTTAADRAEARKNQQYVKTAFAQQDKYNQQRAKSAAD